MSGTTRWVPTTGGELFSVARDMLGQIVVEMKGDEDALPQSGTNVFPPNDPALRALQRIARTKRQLNDLRARLHERWRQQYSSDCYQGSLPNHGAVLPIEPSIVDDWRNRARIEAELLGIEAKILVAYWYGVRRPESPPTTASATSSARPTDTESAILQYWSERCTSWAGQLGWLASHMGDESLVMRIAPLDWQLLSKSAGYLRRYASRMFWLADLLAYGANPAQGHADLMSLAIHSSTLRAHSHPPSAVTTFSSNPDYGQILSNGARTGIRALIDRSMLGSGSHAAQIAIPGYDQGHGNHARGHLLGKQLGGNGDKEENLVTLYQRPWNTPIMSSYEAIVTWLIRHVDPDQRILYTVTPFYHAGQSIPYKVRLAAFGERIGHFLLDMPNEDLPGWNTSTNTL